MALYLASGGANSDSYCSVTYAETYLKSLYGTDLGDWDSLSVAQKEHRLKLGCVFIGYLPLRGRRAYNNQALDFPRVITGEPRALEGRKIPVEVMQAQALIAYGVIHRGLSGESSPDEGGSAGRVSEVSLGGLLSVKFAGAPLTGGTTLLAIIRSSDFPVYAKVKPFLLQARLRNSLSELQKLAVAAALFTTTTTISESTTTTVPVTTTTTV